MKISSRHSIRDLPCKFPEQIYYSELQKQQRKAEIECTSKYKDKKWQEDQDEDISGLQMYTYRNRQVIDQRQEDTDKTN